MNKPIWHVGPGYYFQNKRFCLPPVIDKESNAELMHYIRNGFHLEFIDLGDTPIKEFIFSDNEIEDGHTFELFFIISFYIIVYIITLNLGGNL